MADTTTTTTTTQRLVSETGKRKQTHEEEEEKKNPSKFYSHFFSKSFLVAILLVLLPLFPSQAPEFINQTILTRSWELVHLLFVGIAVSYGLFSRRNVDDTEKEKEKIDNTQTYVSRILQVSSVFDDDHIETQSGSSSSSVDDHNKIQTWNSQYFRGNPMVLVADTNPVVVDEQHHSTTIRTTTTTTSTSTSSSEKEKPLLLPVRSLRSQVSNTDSIKSINEIGGSSSGSSISRSGSGSGSGLKTYSSSNSFRKSGSGEIGGLDPLVLEEKLKESSVLPSPIPWRSRSGRMEMKEEMGVVTPPLYSLPPSMGESEFDRVDSFSRRSSSIKLSSRPHSNSPSPRKLSPSPSLSPEIRAKNVEDLVKKKSFYKSSPPPPPPPPPPPVIRKSPLINASYSSEISDGFSSDKNVKRSFKNELKDYSMAAREDVPSRMDSLKAEAKSRSTNAEGTLSSMGRSVRTIRSNDPVDEVRNTRESGGGTTGSGDRIDQGRTGKRSKEVEATLVEKTGRMPEDYEQQLSFNNRSQVPTFSKYQKEEMKDVFEKVLVDSDEDYNSDSDSAEECSDMEEATTHTMSNASPKTNAACSNPNAGPNPDAGTNNPNEVDKKADEFIAKFREQIRLQRIESIKKTSGKYNNRNSSR